MRVVLCILFVAATANAHDAWIEPRATLQGAELRLVLGERLVPEKPLPFAGMIAVARAPFEVNLDAETFNRYLAEEGHDERLRSDRPIRERVTRHLKTFAGPAFDASFTQRFGTRLEIIPLTIPEAGKPLRVLVMLEGKPLAGALVSFFPQSPRPLAGEGGPAERDRVRAKRSFATPSSAASRHLLPQAGEGSVRTNERGEAEAVLQRGFVLVRTTHIRRGVDVDFESDWAALTFTVE